MLAYRTFKLRSAARYAMNEICDIDGVCATFRCGSAFGIELVSMVAYLKENSNELLSSGDDDNNDIQRIQDFYRWLLLDASKIGNDARCLSHYIPHFNREASADDTHSFQRLSSSSVVVESVQQIRESP